MVFGCWQASVYANVAAVTLGSNRTTTVSGNQYPCESTPRVDNQPQPARLPATIAVMPANLSPLMGLPMPRDIA